MTERILVIAPHPDDAEFGAGGTIIKWVRESKEVYLCVCTNGDKGSSDPEMTSENLAHIRHHEQEAAAKVLGIKEVIFLNYPDGGLEDTREFRGDVVRLVRRIRPGAIATTDPYMKYWSHRDHRIAGMVALDAVWPYARDRLFYPEHAAAGLLPHKVKDVYLWRPEKANHYVDITDVFDQKIKSLKCHKSQVGNRPAHRDVEIMVRQRAEALGKEQNIPLAEAFYHFELPG